MNTLGAPRTLSNRPGGGAPTRRVLRRGPGPGGNPGRSEGTGVRLESLTRPAHRTRWPAERPGAKSGDESPHSKKAAASTDGWTVRRRLRVGDTKRLAGRSAACPPRVLFFASFASFASFAFFAFFRDCLRIVLRSFAATGPVHFTWLSFTGQWFRADSMAACRTRCVWYASAKSGRATMGLPPPRTVKMSAAMFTKPCS